MNNILLPMKVNTQNRMKKRIICILFIFILMGIFLCVFSPTAHAAGLMNETVDTANEYSKYPSENYQLDYYVDSSWDWLPWNWTDGIGKTVMYGLYAITNFLWTVSKLISSATGIVISEAYSFDLISNASNEIGRNMQEIAGISSSGISLDGFYAGFMLLIILIVGIYVTYTGMIKKETTKAFRAVINFLVIFIISAGFLAYAPDYVAKINEFSSDVSSASLTVGTKISMPNADVQGKDSVSLIRENIFAIQVRQPWLLLQFGDSDIDEIGEDRVNAILSASPSENKGKAREDAVKAEISDNDNMNLTVNQTMSRLGTALFLLLINMLISVFLFMLAGMMILSQILFIIYAMFLPISFLLSMIPTFEGLSKRAIVKLFNIIMLRAGAMLVITIAFSISTMCYRLTSGYPFFVVGILQIAVFAIIYLKQDDILSMLSLQSGETRHLGRHLARPGRTAGRAGRKLQRSAGKLAAGIGVGLGLGASRKATAEQKKSGGKTSAAAAKTAPKNAPFSRRAGAVVGNMIDTKNRVMDGAETLTEGVKNLPINASYALHRGKRKLKDGAKNFSASISDTRSGNITQRQEKQESRRQTIAQRRAEMGWTKAAHGTQQSSNTATSGASYGTSGAAAREAQFVSAMQTGKSVAASTVHTPIPPAPVPQNRSVAYSETHRNEAASSHQREEISSRSYTSVPPAPLPKERSVQHETAHRSQTMQSHKEEINSRNHTPTSPAPLPKERHVQHEASHKSEVVPRYETAHRSEAAKPPQENISGRNDMKTPPAPLPKERNMQQDTARNNASLPRHDAPQSQRKSMSGRNDVSVLPAPPQKERNVKSDTAQKHETVQRQVVEHYVSKEAQKLYQRKGAPLEHTVEIQTEKRSKRRLQWDQTEPAREISEMSRKQKSKIGGNEAKSSKLNQTKQTKNNKTEQRGGKA